jgi:two-component system, LuxR family, response regulator FixJ
MTNEPLIFVVDDDDGVRESMRALLQSAGFNVKDYGSAKAFLEDHPLRGGCLIADIRMREMDGLELQEVIVKRGLDLPIIVMTGHGDVPLAVRAMKAGALDFIEKPFDAETMLAGIRRALEISKHARNRLADARAAQELLALLTPRERHVLEQLVAGRSNKIAAYELGISPRTIEIHRAHIMNKMNARSLSDLVRIALAAEQAGGHA